MSSDPKYEGWLGQGPESVDGKMVWGEFEPKAWEESDVEIKVDCCGICGSDLHTLRSGWGPTLYPVCVGHEIVGKAVRVGKNVKNIKVGDRVGIGAQSSSCKKPDCEECSTNNHPYCEHNVGTYNSKWPSGDKSYGGYSTYWRGDGDFCIKIPDALSSEDAAPMMCGGVTVYSPLKRNGCGPGKKVGIIGVGGLGHYGLLFAKALGADKVVAISRSNAKKEDCLKMGADDFIATDEEKDWATKHAKSLDLIVCTVSSPKMPLMEYLQLLRVHGQFIQVGAPEDLIPPFHAFAFIGKGVKFGGSMIGSPAEIEEMLELAAKQNVHSWIEKRPMKEANQTVVDMGNNKARYRYVLVN